MTNGRRVFVLSREYPPSTIGGTGTVARNLCVGLVSAGWEVTLITTAPRSGTDRREQIEGVRVHRSAMDGSYNTASGVSDQTVRAHRRLYRAAEDLAAELGRPDAVVLPDLFCFPEAVMFARRHAIPLLNILLQDFRAITPYDRDAHRVTSGVTADREHLLQLERKAVQDSDHVVFISQALSDAVTAHYTDGLAPHSLVHLGVDPAEIAEVQADPRWRSRRDGLCGDGPDRPLLVACGRLVPVKGFTQLIEALHLMGPVAPPRGGSVALPHLALVGVGPEEGTLRHLAARLDLTDRVTFLGDVPRREALGWMSVADVAVVPSLWESFCYVCAEMMAFGRPVVATAVDSLRELLPDARFGYPVPVGGELGKRTLAPQDLADALREAFADPEEAARRGAAARARILDRFTNDRFAHGVAALLRELTAVTGRA
ncbi:glycosyltransferase family 4 protein [Sphaerisporangium rhizosphaerae]|uniref:Glycosyltransferase family 4 protein n=1 Tax=Sphaerisporangium rhizosphaerae TaxID=2269375 RepID=A0ABW2PDL5_9ACTN